eukprot:TRINITY_DN43977_c0_g1_i1.p1 TRINITY_DN43977_c0_g1~~TRINITY_DN43977_c0_g1_i1.p1  ORF type:complete len:415 (-),score=41.76 TRINITY_DN43977_c0_g1_i1:54-1193(-)
MVFYVLQALILGKYTLVGLAFQEDAWHLIDVPSIVCPNGTGFATVTICKDCQDWSQEKQGMIYITSSEFVLLTLTLKSSEGIIFEERLNLTGRPDVADARRLGVANQASVVSETLTFGLEVKADTICENLFLLDDRSPIDLPKTMRDARVAFSHICEHRGFPWKVCADMEETVFRGYAQEGSHMMAVDEVLCSRIAIVLDVFDNADSGANAVDANPRQKERPVDLRSARVRVRLAINRRSNSDIYSRYDTFATFPDCVSLVCISEIELPEETIGYKISLLAYEMRKVKYPLELTITHLEGPDYDPSRICPPAGWAPGSATWHPPAREDMFFTTISLGPGKVPSETPFAFVAVFLLLWCCCCVCFGRQCDQRCTRCFANC